MDTEAEINQYLESLPEAKSRDLGALHETIREMMPTARLWFSDGRNDEGKIVANPNIGYGVRTIKYADGKSREFYQIGLSSSKKGISIYILGIEDKNCLRDTFGTKIGRASVTGYCIKFKMLKDIDTSVLKEAIRLGLERTKAADSATDIMLSQR